MGKYARLSLLGFTLLSAAACKRQEALQIGTTQRKVVLSLPLAHDTAVGSTTCPILHVIVNGKPTRFIVDTGATFHAITKWFVDDLGIETRSYAEDTARDYVGSPIEVARSSPLDVLASGTMVVRHTVIPVVSTTVLGRQLGIGGVLSPRLLLPPRFTAVLELRTDRLAVVAGALGTKDPWGGSKSLAPNGMQSCGTKGVYLVPAEAYGTSALMRLDTGSQETSVFASSKLGQILSSKLAVASGARSSITQQFERVPGLSLRAGDVGAKLDVKLIPGEPSSECRYDGLLGMDLLKRCTVALDQETGFAQCD